MLVIMVGEKAAGAARIFSKALKNAAASSGGGIFSEL
jgi:hypothetical protein